MAYTIIETCTACGLCVPECPIDAIAVADPIYVIDDSCCDFEDCLAVCPVDAIVPLDPNGTQPYAQFEGRAILQQGPEFSHSR